MPTITKEILQRALKTSQSPEVSYRLKLILKKIAPVKLVKNPKFILFERVSHILEIIGTEKAKNLKEKLSK